MKVGEVFESKVKVLRGYDRENNKVLIEEISVEWQVVEIYDERNILCKSKNGELKRFMIDS